MNLTRQTKISSSKHNYEQRVTTWLPPITDDISFKHTPSIWSYDSLPYVYHDRWLNEHAQSSFQDNYFA
ncbi:hypothetical protein CHS0354_028758 [Potamilus streckersoni]|uniref:Uncharacterized protein n=1 Tax=Potamilus streckersoni TaxID=2493646 RepID=A0AAE0VRD3_9BIVA|nr:hypothetical protein CHS0354_028758 [Potamilus streckersoni]